MFLIQQCQMSSGPHGPIFLTNIYPFTIILNSNCQVASLSHFLLEFTFFPTQNSLSTNHLWISNHILNFEFLATDPKIQASLSHSLSSQGKSFKYTDFDSSHQKHLLTLKFFITISGTQGTILIHFITMYFLETGEISGISSYLKSEFPPSDAILPLSPNCKQNVLCNSWHLPGGRKNLSPLISPKVIHLQLSKIIYLYIYIQCIYCQNLKSLLVFLMALSTSENVLLYHIIAQRTQASLSFQMLNTLLTNARTHIAIGPQK